MSTMQSLQAELGNASEFICDTDDKARMLRQWAVASGTLAPAEALTASVVSLINLYHDHDAEARARAQAFLDTCKALKGSKPPAVAPPKAAEPARKREGMVPHYRTELVLTAVRLGHPVMLVGPAGCGKTTIGEAVAAELELPIYITSTINDVHELHGFIDGRGVYHRTAFREAFEHGGVWVADEIDAWDAAALLAANSALANGLVTFPDAPEPMKRHPNFRMIATANTFGTGADRVYIGRNELDAASLDRFAVIEVDYDLDIERILSQGNDDWLDRVWSVRRAVADKKVRHVVSTRAIMNGAAALGAGMARADVEKLYLFKGMSSNDKAKINEMD